MTAHNTVLCLIIAANTHRAPQTAPWPVRFTKPRPPMRFRCAGFEIVRLPVAVERGSIRPSL
jgi:hypothetical protein